MKVRYDAEAHVLIFVLKDGFPANAIAEQGSVIVSYDETGEPISLKFLNASQRDLIHPELTELKIYR